VWESFTAQRATLASLVSGQGSFVDLEIPIPEETIRDPNQIFTDPAGSPDHRVCDQCRPG
jgi:hypothetical protein